MTVVTRFAPSPTERLHLGTARIALFNYLFAKQHKGKSILRIEDTDQKRYKEGSIDNLVGGLTWLGILPDEGYGIGGHSEPYQQSKRNYNSYIDDLIEVGAAYRVFDDPLYRKALNEELEIYIKSSGRSAKDVELSSFIKEASDELFATSD